MVCIRCQMVVRGDLEKLGIRYINVNIGEADIVGKLLPDQLAKLDLELRKSGLLLMDDKKSILVEKIKSSIIELVHYTEEQIMVNLSDLTNFNNIQIQYIPKLFNLISNMSYANSTVVRRTLFRPLIYKLFCTN